MKITHTTKYTDEQKDIVWQCLDEINALKCQYLDLDDDEIEDEIGDELDKVYVYYKELADSQDIIDPEGFDDLAQILFSPESEV